MKEKKRLIPNVGGKKAPSPRAHAWLWGALLVAATVLAYQQVWHAGFIWDDDDHLTANPCIVGPLGFRGIWMSSAATYYPLVLTTFWAEHALWGLRPLPYHLVNVAVFAASAVLLWRVLRHLDVRGAWLGAALWALHPVQVESAAWVTELKNTESGFFYLLAIFFFVKWRQGTPTVGPLSGEWTYAATLLCTVLAILSKTSTVMLPVVLGLCWWWLDGRWRWRNLLRLAPFFLISAAASGWTIWEQKYHSGALGSEWTQSWPERVIVAGRAVWFYLEKLVWPHPLIFIYPRWTIDASHAAAYLPAAAVVAGLFILWWHRDGRLRPVFFAFAYFLVSLFPVLDFFNVYFFRYSFVGDHFQYLASIGPLALAGAGLTTAFGFLKSKNPLLAPTCGTALLLTLGTLTWRQVGMYADLETLWRTTLARNPACWMAHGNLGDVLLRRGRTDEAFAHFQRAVQLNPNYEEGHYNLGTALLEKGRVDEAIVEFQQALAIRADYAQARNNLGKALLKKGRIDEAGALFARALALQPDFAEAHTNLGNVLLQQGEVDEAIGHLQRALEIEPANAEAHNNLGNALFQKGRFNEAVAHYESALALRPDFVEAHYNLGNYLLQSGGLDDAIAHFQRALEIEPGMAQPQIALTRIAWMLATAPDPAARDGAKAVALARQADQLAGGGNPMMAATLAAACAEAGQFPAAIDAARRAAQLAAAQGQPAMAAAIEAQLQAYLSGVPFREAGAPH